MSNLDLIYDVPASLAEQYHGKRVKVRTVDPGSFLDSLDEKDLDLLACIQVDDLTCDLEALQQFDYAVPLELMLVDPEADFPKLYAFSTLVESFPIRACIPLLPGFGKAVRVAAALHFAIKIELDQPETTAVSELIKIMDFYLHSSGVTEPIEFFHSLLMSYYHDQAITLWEIQGETPQTIRHIGLDGKISFPGRLAGCASLPTNPAAHSDCRNCSYLITCAGYFKWPDAQYDCEGIKQVLVRIEAAAEQLRTDIEIAEADTP